MSSFKSQAKSLSDRYDKYVPMVHIYGIAKNLCDMLAGQQKEAKKAKAKLNQEKESIINKYVKSQESFNVEWTNVVNRFKNMVDTFSRRCDGAWTCGGASSAMKSEIGHIASSLDEMRNAFDSIYWPNSRKD